MAICVGVLEHSGTIDWVAHGAVSLGAPLLVAIALCVIVGLGPIAAWAVLVLSDSF